MKQSLFFILSLFALQAASGQDWPAPNSEWSYCIDGFGGPYGTHTYIYSRDTTLNDTTYAMIRRKFAHYTNDEPYTDQDAFDNDNMTFLRQANDTIYRRVDNTEYVFFINGLNVGDTFTTYRSVMMNTNVFWCIPDLDLQVIEVTTVTIEGEEYRRVSMQDVNIQEIGAEIPTPSQPVVYHYIEGIGLENNFPYFLTLTYSFGGECGMVTDGADGEYLFAYQNNDEDLVIFDCIPSGVSEYQAIQFSIAPNPAREILQLNGLDEANMRFEIFDTAGKLVNQGLLNHNLIDVSKLNSGLYLLVIISADGDKGLQKFMVE